MPMPENNQDSQNRRILNKRFFAVLLVAAAAASGSFFATIRYKENSEAQHKVEKLQGVKTGENSETQHKVEKPQGVKTGENSETQHKVEKPQGVKTREVSGEVFITLKSRETLKLSMVDIHVVDDTMAARILQTCPRWSTNELTLASILDGLLKDEPIWTTNNATWDKYFSAVCVALHRARSRLHDLESAKAEAKAEEATHKTNVALAESNRDLLRLLPESSRRKKWAANEQYRQTELMASIDSRVKASRLSDDVWRARDRVEECARMQTQFLSELQIALAKTVTTDADGRFQTRTVGAGKLWLVALASRETANGSEEFVWVVPLADEQEPVSLCNNNLIQENSPGNIVTVKPDLPAQQSEADRKLLADIRAKAENGDAHSQYELGAAFAKGSLGVARDGVEAVKWYRKAAEQNYALAQYNLGVCCDEGQGVTKDEAEAMNWYRKAAEQNYAAAQNNLGACYAIGQGVAKNDSEAVNWYRKAAEQGNAEAQRNLGWSYFDGKGVAKDYVEAYKWNLLAAGQGKEDSKRAVSTLEAKMSQEQIAEGQEFARNFKPRAVPAPESNR